MILLKSLKFWTLVVALVLFVIQAYVPSFPFDESTLLKAVLFVLGLFQIEPEIRAVLKR
jgi:hypothetical protein